MYILLLIFHFTIFFCETIILRERISTRNLRKDNVWAEFPWRKLSQLITTYPSYRRNLRTLKPHYCAWRRGAPVAIRSGTNLCHFVSLRDSSRTTPWLSEDMVSLASSQLKQQPRRRFRRIYVAWYTRTLRKHSCENLKEVFYCSHFTLVFAI